MKETETETETDTGTEDALNGYVGFQVSVRNASPLGSSCWMQGMGEGELMSCAAAISRVEEARKSREG